MSNVQYLYEYFKINYFTVCLFVFWAVLSLCKDLKFPKMTVNRKTWLLGILILGLLLRLAWLALSPNHPFMTRLEGAPNDNDLINIHAVDITKGIWFENADGTASGRRPIGYPIFLALFYGIFGPHVQIVWSIQI